MTRDLLLLRGNTPIGALQIVRRDAECWDWAWQRSDGEIVIGSEQTENEAAKAAGRVIVEFYEGMN